MSDTLNQKRYLAQNYLDKYYETKNHDYINKLKKLEEQEEENESYVKIALAETLYNVGKFNYALDKLNEGSIKKIDNRFYRMYSYVLIEFQEYGLAYEYYKKYAKSVVFEIDVLIMQQLLKHVATNDVCNISLGDSFFVSSENKKYRGLLRNIAQCLNSENYKGALAGVYSLRSECPNSKIPFRALVSLIKQSINLENNFNKKRYQECLNLLKSNILEKKYDEALDRLSYLLQFYTVHTKYILCVMLKLAESGKYNEVEVLLEKLKTQNGVQNLYGFEINYIKQVIKEKQELDNLNINTTNEHYNILLKAKYYLEDKDYEKAYELYYYGYYVTRLNVYQYYMGKCLYKLHKSEEAADVLVNYCVNGGDKLNKAYMYLSSILCGFNRKKESLNYSKKQNRLDSINNFDSICYISLNDYQKEKLSKVKGYN